MSLIWTSYVADMSHMIHGLIHKSYVMLICERCMYTEHEHTHTVVFITVQYLVQYLPHIRNGQLPRMTRVRLTQRAITGLRGWRGGGAARYKCSYCAIFHEATFVAIGEARARHGRAARRAGGCRKAGGNAAPPAALLPGRRIARTSCGPACRKPRMTPSRDYDEQRLRILYSLLKSECLR